MQAKRPAGSSGRGDKEGKAKKYPNLASLNKFHKGHRGKIALLMVLTALSGGLFLAYPFASSRIIINLTSGNFGEMLNFAAVLLGLIALNAVADYAAGYLSSVISKALFFDMRKTLVDKTISLSLSAVYEKGSGFFLERMNEDSREASNAFLSISKLVIKLAVNLTFIAYIAAVNAYLALVFLAGLTVIVFLEYFRVSRMLANMKKSKRAMEKIKSAESELLKGIKEIKGLGGREAIVAKHSGASDALLNIRKAREKIERNLSHGITLIKAAIDFAILLFVAFVLVPQGEYELAGILAVWNYKGNIYELVSSLAGIKDLFVNGELAAKRLNDILSAPENEVDRFGELQLPSAAAAVEFRDAVFGYLPGQPILKGVSFEARAPAAVGFVGRSGSGKSTIFSLLTNFYRPQGGRALINGIDVTELSEGALRGAVTPVLQDPYIFNDTVLNNIRFAKPSASDGEVFAAARKACIHDEILEMKDGYGTVIGENGATVSGGQKQRLEIARALLKDTPILLFDEATSALDKANLNKINDLLIELGKEKLVFVIAHRLAVMRRCDRVVVLDDGKIIASGTHGELMQSSAYYQELFKKSGETPTETRREER
ncbi:MAG: ABC transporter ATP-binding protein/permease [Clostridiales bacterium]|jgi:ABC-type multidrug transport system fused ATPase/permease subunit|nr:ABC transporter ATP-binding protein/permease [Clostridiales bacterium]